MRRDLLILLAAVVLVRLPFLSLPVQGDDVYYQLIAEHARVDPLHPMDFSFRLQGETVWAAGHTRPPFAGLFQAALLEIFGGMDVVLFHLAYILFSAVAVVSMYSLGRWFFTDRGKALWASLLYLAVPAFLVNGNKLEADIPLLAFWTLGIALFVHQRFLLSAVALALAGFTGYQAVLAVPILAHLAWYKHRAKPLAWVAVLSAPALAVAWQLFERFTVGVAPAEVLGGYADQYGLIFHVRKLHSSLALLGHLGWMLSPVAVVAAWRGRSLLAGLAGGLALSLFLPADYTVPERALYALSAACGITVLLAAALATLRERIREGGFVGAWILVFFLGALALFYAGSARYLLPLAPALCLLAVQQIPSRAILATAFALNLSLGSTLAWSERSWILGQEQFARSLHPLAQGKRIWSNGEWGLRYALSQIGGESLLADQTIPAGAVVVESDLAAPIPYQVEGVRRELLEQSAWMGPLRTAGRGSHSGYSSSEFGVLPFALGGAPVERMTASQIGAPQATAPYLTLADPTADSHILSGFYPSDGADWRWMQPEAAALLKAPPTGASSFEFQFHIPEDAPTRRVQVEIDGRLVADQHYDQTGGYTLTAPVDVPPNQTVRVVLRADRSYAPPGDQRTLSLVAISFGLR